MRDASALLHFGDGEQRFRLRIGQLLELQDKVNRSRLQMLVAAGVDNPLPIGPGRLIAELGRGDLWPHEIREILRIGLIGGGMRPAAADVLLHRYLPTYPLGDISFIALQVLSAAFEGEEVDPVGKEQSSAGAEAAAPPPADSPTHEPTTSTGEASTPAASSLDSHLDKSTTPQSLNSATL